MNLPFLAGTAATLIFAASTLPMLSKARRTRDLSSYSLGNITLANVGNLVQSVYVLSLPPGPIWALHAFHLAATGLMLCWFLRYGRPRRLLRRDQSLDSSTCAIIQAATDAVTAPTVAMPMIISPSAMNRPCVVTG